MPNPSLMLRGGSSGPTYSPSTPGYLLAIDSDGKSVVPVPPPAVVPTELPFVNVKNSPWFLKGDGSDETAAMKAMFAFYNATGLGITFYWPIGVYGATDTLDYPLNSIFIGESQVGSELKLLRTSPPVDLLRLPSQLQQGGIGVGSVRTMIFSNDTTRNFQMPVWTPGTFVQAGSYAHPTAPSPIVLKCIQAGVTGAHEPIGVLTPYLARTRLTGTANASCQPVFRVTTPGHLGVMQFELSTDGGGAFGGPIPTVAGESFFYAIPGFGGSYGIIFSDQPYALPIGLTISAPFVQPAVGASVAVTFASIAAVALFDRVLCAGGLYRVTGMPGGSQLTLFNWGTAAAAAPGVVVGAGAAIIVEPPHPKVEVLGTPSVDDQIVDVLTQGGPLGSAASTFAYGQASVPGTSKWKFNLTVGQSGLQPTVAGAFYDFAVPATPLTLRIHTGILPNTGTWSYFTPAAQWSLMVGERVTDGTAIWEVLAGPGVFRNVPTGFSAVDCYVRGGVAAFIMREGISSVLGGNSIITDTLYANVWYPNGDSTFGEQTGSTNANTIEGAIQMYGPGYGVVHDGGFGFECSGVNFQGHDCFMFLAGLIGADIGGLYLEARGGLMMNCAEASRLFVGRCTTPCVKGSFLGSTQNSASTFEMYAVESPAFVGCTLGGKVAGLTGLNTCIGDVTVKACTHIRGKPLLDSLPPSGDVSGLGVSGVMAFQITNNFAGNTFMTTPPLSGRFRVSAYVALLVPGTTGAATVQVVFKDSTGVSKTLTLAAIADISVAGSAQGGEAIIQTDGVTQVTMQLVGVVTAGALNLDFSASLMPDIA